MAAKPTFTTAPRLSFAAGPTLVPASIASHYCTQFASPDLEPAFVDTYTAAGAAVRRLVRAPASHSVVVQSGEAMLCLWGALKSVVKPGEHVLSVGTGLFGYGIADMAKQVGCQVTTIGGEYDATVDDALLRRVRQAAEAHAPKLITAVHCETPSGTLNPLRELGAIAREVGALFYVDFVSSGGAAEVDVGEWAIDLGLLGTQKALCLPPDLGIVVVSPRAWSVIDEVGYVGYDALKPWQHAVEKAYFPYTHNWRAVQALEAAATRLLDEGLDKVFARHQEAAEYCRTRLRDMGVRLFPRADAVPSPSVTTAYVPDGWTWEDFDRALRERGVLVAGNYAKLAGKTFRIGHMGDQANMELLAEALDVIESVLKEQPPQPQES